MSASPLEMAAIQASSSAAVRQFGVGNAPTMPALQAAITSSGPETRNIGAAKTGIRRRKGTLMSDATHTHLRRARNRVAIRAMKPATPVGMTYMNAIMKEPYTAHVTALEIWSARFGTNWMKKAPKIAPDIDATPPMTAPTRSPSDRKIEKLSGETNCVTSAPSAPAIPVYMALTPNVSDL